MKLDMTADQAEELMRRFGVEPTLACPNFYPIRTDDPKNTIYPNVLGLLIERRDSGEEQVSLCVKAGRAQHRSTFGVLGHSLDDSYPPLSNRS